MVTKDEDLGQRFDRVLGAHGINKAKLAKKAKVTPGAVGKWRDALSRGDITSAAWHSCARALIAAGIDPNEVRPGAPLPTRSAANNLIPAILDVTDHATLSLLLEVLTLENDADRETLVAVTRAALKKL